MKKTRPTRTLLLRAEAIRALTADALQLAGAARGPTGISNPGQRTCGPTISEVSCDQACR
jgi:hypothetical protein